MPLTRRSFVQLCTVASTLPFLPACKLQPDSDQFSRCVDEIVKNTTRPVFPDRQLSIETYGAKRGASKPVTQAINQAIEDCHLAGGGIVLVPAGDYLTGPIRLKSNVNLHLEQGAILRFSTDPNDYLPPVYTHWEGVALMGYSPLIYAYGETNIAITGKGVLDGQSTLDDWWYWKGKDYKAHRPESPDQAKARKELFDMAEAGVPVENREFAKDSYLRPSFIQPVQCKNVLIEGVTIKEAPFWLVHPLLCENVTVSGIRCESHGPNSDGCDPESCRNVVIENCYFDTGDDCIAIKSGRNADGRRIATPTENVVVRNCQMKAGHGGVVIGSEISGGVRNVYVENCVMSSPDLERAIRIKTNAMRGGLLENLHYRNIQIGQVQDAFVINFYYEEGKEGVHMPTVRNITIENIQIDNTQRAFLLRGFEEAPIDAISFKDITIKNAEAKGVVEYVNGMQLENVTIAEKPVVF